MSISEYLDAEPFREIVSYRRAGAPQDAVDFIGTQRKHPYDDEKLTLTTEPASVDAGLFEFRVADVLSAQDLPSPVRADGESWPLVKLWVRKGSIGVRYEPFEVDRPRKPLGAARVEASRLVRRET